MPSPLAEWRAILLPIDGQFAVAEYRDLNRKYAWAGDTTLPTLQPRFEMFQRQVPDFFERFGYDWVLEKDEYEFPHEVLLQHNALEMLLSLYVQDFHTVPESLPQICMRLTSQWNLMDGAPHAVPRGKNFGFIAFPMAWLDLISYFVSTLFLHSHKFLERSFPNAVVVKPRQELNDIYLSLAARTSSSRHAMPDWYEREALARAQKTLGHESFPRPMSQPGLRAYFESACFRFVIGHEIGHFIEGEARERSQVLSEAYADQIALLATRLHAVSEPAQHQQARPHSDAFIVTLFSELFFFVYRGWLVSVNAQASLRDEKASASSDRNKEFQKRKQLADRAREELLQRDILTDLSKLERGIVSDITESMEYTLAEYQRYLDERFSDVNAALDREFADLENEYPDPWDLPTYRKSLKEAFERVRRMDIKIVDELGNTSNLRLE